MERRSTQGYQVFRPSNRSIKSEITHPETSDTDSHVRGLAFYGWDAVSRTRLDT